MNMASAAGLGPRPGMVPYATSKFAVVGLSTSLRYEAEDLGVRVNVVCPFNVSTSIFKRTVYKNLDHEAMLAAVPIQPSAVDRCVQKILQGMQRNRAIITMPFFARFEWCMYRMIPRVANAS